MRFICLMKQMPDVMALLHSYNITSFDFYVQEEITYGIDYLAPFLLIGLVLMIGYVLFEKKKISKWEIGLVALFTIAEIVLKVLGIELFCPWSG